jgi:uncharacterized protein (DUF2235 family)
MAKSKKIVVCCDGTGNGFENADEESNVVKLYSCLALDESQVGYYHPGVGTMGDPRARTRFEKQWSRLKGLAFGAGLLDNVGDAYRYLMNTYADGDEIYLFGFSRGAFTARALASVLHVFGLLCAGNEGLIPYVLRIYAQRTRAAKRLHTTFETDDVFRWQFSHAQETTIHFCGLWDTVSSYGWAYDPIMLPFNGNNPIIRRGRHAVSIHERRCFYRDNLWGAAQPDQDIRQVWFSGVHSDVGGSYIEREAGLSKITLEWMLVEAKAAGLNLDDEKVSTILGRSKPARPIRNLPAFSQPDRNGMLHNSLQGVGWWLLEYLPHRYPDRRQQWSIPRGHKRTIPAGSLLHDSVLRGPYFSGDQTKYQREPWVPYFPADRSLAAAGSVA